VNAKGESLGEYSLYTKALKQSDGRISDHVTLNDTGDFYNSFSVYLSGSNFIVSANTIKDTSDLIADWGRDILGLNEESLKLLREKAYKDIAITNNMRKRVSLKTLTSGMIYGQDLEGTHHKYQDNTSKIDWLEQFLDGTNEVITIFYQYNVELEALETLMQKLKKRYIVINGNTKDAVELVKRDDYDVIVGQFQAMSESIDGMQHRSHIEVFMTMPESSLTYKQAIGRIDRIGQEKVPMYYYLVMENTLDDKIYKLIEQKLDYSEQILEQLVIEED
jgi:hypothetical protein